ncbi:hypothetical protein K435DRAFT_845910 [Dendrothele bispora CBS 962.96]|uniref:Uncharacterized protein n=1 Tax=Dendrothele bispora (strain CBS 962.96) TaxID=1314807 RepID=A0A4S8KQU8_DENBC|nr:hypothetical protein K435DRAFT_845910 [Dendrothele bispora CBS 962.96]
MQQRKPQTHPPHPSRSRAPQENRSPQERVISQGRHQRTQIQLQQPLLNSTRRITRFLLIGKYFARAIHLSCNIRGVVFVGREEEYRQQRLKVKDTRAASSRRARQHHAESESDEEDPEAGMTERELRERQRSLDAYAALVKRFPVLKQRLDECSLYDDTTLYEILLSTIHTGSKEARANDTKTLKTKIIDWIPTIIDNSILAVKSDPNDFAWGRLNQSVLKSERGINNKRIAMLLLPWQDAQRFWVEGKSTVDVDSIMSDIRSGVIPPLKSDSLPAFLFSFAKYKPDQIYSGLLFGPLLIAAFKCIFTSPSSAIEPKFVRTKAGNAQKLDIKAVTPELLVYVAAQACALRFVPYPVVFLYGAPVQWREKTFRALNEEFFGPADDDDNDEPALDSDMALLSEHFQNYIDSDDEDANFSSTGQTSSPRQTVASSTVPSSNGSTAQDQENTNHDVNEPTSRSAIEDPMALDKEHVIDNPDYVDEESASQENDNDTGDYGCSRSDCEDEDEADEEYTQLSIQRGRAGFRGRLIYESDDTTQRVPKRVKRS